MNYVLFPVAHGVEIKPVTQDYAGPLISRINAYLTEEEKGYFIPLAYNYSIKTDPRQMEMFQAVEAGLGNQELRRLKHIVGSDVTWSFILAKCDGPCFYRDFVTDVTKLIERAMIRFPGAKIVCCGHSQGSQLFLSFLFDFPNSVDGFISMGSPISMNSGAYDDWGRRPPNLGFWMNFYNDMDFISSRLQGVHPSKEIADFVEDYKVPSSWNPIFHLPQFIFKIQLYAGFKAHISYWESDFVAKTIAERIKNLMNQPASKP